MILSHTSARKGSTSLVRKKFRLIVGKPLIDWPLGQFFRNENIDGVATDDTEIYEHGLKRVHLMLDGVPKNWEMMKHAKRMFDNNTNAASVNPKIG